MHFVDSITAKKNGRVNKAFVDEQKKWGRKVVCKWLFETIVTAQDLTQHSTSLYIRINVDRRFCKAYSILALGIINSIALNTSFVRNPFEKLGSKYYLDRIGNLV